jgi:hypothetical protein
MGPTVCGRDDRDFKHLSGWSIRLLASSDGCRDVAVPAHNETTILTGYEVVFEYPNYVDYVGILTAERRLPAHTLLLDCHLDNFK